ncbi:hypothetical protein CWE13_02745 [Aliidiomarina shirensis]|uniref:SnoaL-like domain-containing protein n=1 Tax=Aliidiomarina shirensis TaxID=1048642 RepID=A0A432WXQ7_9GAMM|nr:nuclear transport factor 2 family protein [Aliidiomarina shirensis]RUO38580.1 hypothetical protein CWE13_02745 [Aliidiomarina shirensis]
MSNLKTFLARFNQAWAEHDIKTIIAGVTDDIRFQMATDDTGIKGKEAFEKWLTEMMNPDYKVTMNTERLFISGNDAALSGSMEMVDPTGAEHKFAFCDLYTLRDGKVSELRAYVMDYKADKSCPASSE